MPSLDARTIQPHRIGSGPAVVLLHGINSTRHVWKVLGALTRRYEFISYDLPGHGDSAAASGPYEIEDLSDQLGILMTEWRIAQAHIVGSSIGGMIAQHFAATHPERVGHLVLCDTSPALSEGKRDEFLAIGGEELAAMARADLMDLAEEIYAPTLVLCADGAELAMREGADFLARSIPSGQLAFVPRTVADVVTEQPDWVAHVLLDFLG